MSQHSNPAPAPEHGLSPATCCCFLCSVNIFNEPWKSIRQWKANHRNEGQKALQEHPSEAEILELTLLTEGWANSSNLRWAFFRQVALKSSQQCQFQGRKRLFQFCRWVMGFRHRLRHPNPGSQGYSYQPFTLNGNLICDSADQCRCLKNYYLTSSITEP